MPAGWPDNTDRLTGADTYEVVAAASNNAALITAGAGVVTGWYCGNIAAAFRYVKLYDKGSSPSPGSDTPFWVIAIPALSGANAFPIHPLHFSSGLGIAIVAGIANNDNSSVSANDVVASISYL